MQKAVQDALRLLFANDGFLLETDCQERAIAARLGVYLAPHFPRHSVDVEYNRHGLEPKRLILPETCRGGGERLIVPDLVVHQRGHDQENILVVQIKKETNHQSRDCDRAVVAGMRAVFGYAFGLLIDLPAGPGATNREAHLEWV
jgi:hypothetical protein